MNDFEKKRWEAMQELFCKGFSMSLFLVVPYLMFLWLMFPQIGVFIGNPVHFFLTDVFLSMGIGVYMMENEKKSIRKFEGN